LLLVGLASIQRRGTVGRGGTDAPFELEDAGRRLDEPELVQLGKIAWLAGGGG